MRPPAAECRILKLYVIENYQLSSSSRHRPAVIVIGTEGARRFPKIEAVLTPWGHRDSANVHEVAEGYELTRMPDGHMRMENPTTGDHVDFAKAPALAVKPLPDSGWQTYASWYNSGDVATSYTTTFKVPALPSNDDGQILYQFNGIEPASYDSIIQPVLQYGNNGAFGGSYWCVASWYVTSSNEAFYTKYVKVKPGKSLTGKMTLTAQKSSGDTYVIEFEGISKSKLTMKGIEEMVWFAETLEVYNVDVCADYPNQAFLEMSKIDIKIKSKTAPASWVTQAGDPACGVQTTIVTQGGKNAAVDIYY